MTETPTNDQPSFVAEQPEHCFACYHLIRRGQTYYLTIEQEVPCTDCALDEDVVRVRDDLAIEIECDRMEGGKWTRKSTLE